MENNSHHLLTGGFFPPPLFLSSSSASSSKERENSGHNARLNLGPVGFRLGNAGPQCLPVDEVLAGALVLAGVGDTLVDVFLAVPARKAGLAVAASEGRYRDGH